MKNIILILTAIILASHVSYGQATEPPALTPPWVMHKIDNHFNNHNSLGEGDINRDGYTDYAVVHEGANKFTFILHPGKDGNPKAPWEKVTVGRSQAGHPEYECFGDFDGDGFLDIVGVVDHRTGAKGGAPMFWGPETSRVTDSQAWKYGGVFKQTENRGHFLWAQAKDINRDGALDIVMGGRVTGTHGLENVEVQRTAGIVWLEAPAEKRDRRDLAKWKIHDIDSKTKGGRGFEFIDVDGDGYEDIVNCSADWNTPASEVRVVWYRNPGKDSAALRDEWPEHTIYKGNGDQEEFGYSKVLVALGDLDGDGLVDVCVPTGKDIYYFRQVSAKPVKWEKVVIPRPEKTRWFHVPLAMADLNGDGKMDLVGALAHDLNGNLPADKASVYMMTYEGEHPTADNWTTHAIKQSDGVNTGHKFQGEKWDHIRFADVDGDGDLDIVANSEEHYTGEKTASGKVKIENRKTIIGVAWFENPRITRSGHANDVKSSLSMAQRKTKPAPPDLTKPPLDTADIATLPKGLERVEIFLLMGQSNMKGRGVMPAEPLRNPQIIMMHKGTDEWFLARHPLHLVGRPTDFKGADNAGVGPGLAFAETLAAAQPTTRIALIPCAKGGSNITQWRKGRTLYDEAVRRAQLALEQGPTGKTRIAGALWLQGESDKTTPEKIKAYPERLALLIDNLRADTRVPDLPFIFFSALLEIDRAGVLAGSFLAAVGRRGHAE